MGIYDTFKQTQPKTGTSIYQQFQQQKVAPKQSGGFISSVADFVSKPVTFLANNIQSAFQNKAKTELNPVKGMVTETAKAWTSAVDDSAKRINTMLDAYKKQGVLDAYAKTAQTGLGFVNVFFSPISGVMKGLETHPVFGWPAAAVNGIFGAVGQGSSDIALKVLDKAPFSEETKKNLTPLISETASLIGMIAAGKGGEVAFSKMRTNTKTILDTVRSDSVFDGTPKPPTGAKPTPEERYRAYLKSQGYEPYQNPSTLPVIDFGAGKKSNLPTINIGEKTPTKLGSYSYEPIDTAKSPVYSKFIEETQPSTPKQTTTTKPADYTTFQSETNLKLVEQAKEAGIPISEDVPVQERMKNQQALSVAKEIVTNDPARADRIISGDEAPPPDTLRSAVYLEAKNKALAEADVSRLENLSRQSVGTDPARELQILNERNQFSADPVNAMREIRLDREAKNKGIKPENAMKQVKTEAGKIAPPDKMTWDSFVKSLEC